MQFNLRSLLVSVLVVALCAGAYPAVAYGNVFALNALPALSLLVLSVTLALPLVCSPASRLFWCGYSCAAALFAVLVNSGENTLHFVVRDCARWIASTELVKGIDVGFHMFTWLQFSMTMLIPYLAGITSGVILSFCFSDSFLSTDRNSDLEN